jgi:hypothetical protein
MRRASRFLVGVVRPRARRALLAATLFSAGLAVAPSGAAAATTTLYVSVGGSGVAPCETPASPCPITTAFGQIDSSAQNGNAVTLQLAAGTYPQYAAVVANESPTSVTITGAGAGSTILTGGWTSGTSCSGLVTPLKVAAGVGFPVTIKALTLEDGCTTGFGADLLDEGASTVTLDSVAIDGGYSGDGGLADIVAGGVLDINQSAISGGTNDTFGTTVDDGTLNLTNSFVGLTSGIGVFVDAGQASVIGSTIATNTTGGVSSETPDAVTLAGDILFGNGGDGNCDYPVIDDGYNISDDTTCGFTAATSTQGAHSVVDALLGTLSLPAGPLSTVSITPSSDAYDVVPASAIGVLSGFCAGSDEEGVSRLQVGQETCDTGAYQVSGQNFPPAITGVSSASAAAGAPVTLTGTNLGYETTVAFGATAATIIAQSATPIPVTNPDGHSTIAFSVPAPPPPLAAAISITGWSVNVHKSSIQSNLSCANQACSGRLTVTSSFTKTIKEKHHKTKHVTITTTIASGSYTLAAGAGGEFTLKLTKHDKALYTALKKKHHLHPLLTVSVNGGSTATSSTP